MRGRRRLALLNKAALLSVALLTGGCNVIVRDQWQTDARYTAVIVAQTRRAQLLVEIERLEKLLRRTTAVDMRAVLHSQLNRARYEIDQLNVIIER